jgi:hypothetical protein
VHHNDLDIQNRLINPNGDLTGIIDWENIHTSPLWYGCQLPKFLCGPSSHDMPGKDKFMIIEDGKDEPVLDNVYWLRLRQYEQTQLRKVFFEEMEQVCPEWVRVFDESTDQADFELAVQNIDNELCCQKILRWIKGAMDDEDQTSLQDLFWG